MKDQKMKLLKQIKLLNDEKNIFSSKFKECKENCNKLKTQLDQKMAEYQRLQAEYDALSSAAGKQTMHVCMYLSLSFRAYVYDFCFFVCLRLHQVM
jgi:chromosome segregation ATPase